MRRRGDGQRLPRFDGLSRHNMERGGIAEAGLQRIDTRRGRGLRGRRVGIGEPANGNVGGGGNRNETFVLRILIGAFPRVGPAVVLPRIDDHPVIDAQPGGARSRTIAAFIAERRQRGQPQNQRPCHVSRSRPNCDAR